MAQQSRESIVEVSFMSVFMSVFISVSIIGKEGI